MNPPTSNRLTAAVLWCLLPAAAGASPALPWREAEFSDRQAAAHLLDRIAFGARPGEVERVVGMGLEVWLDRQLRAGLPDPAVDRRLEKLETLTLTSRQMVARYPPPGRVLREAMEAGVISTAAMDEMRSQGNEAGRRFSGDQRQKVMEYARSRGYRPQREALGELLSQKLLRARYSENQLREVLTDFWLNHFNVSLTDNESRSYVATYEREAIRPHVLGRFRDLLRATAKHPAMLLYLDNARSVADEGAPTTFDLRMRNMPSRGGGLRGAGGERRRAFGGERPQGLNENYARELLELHTLGVDGGYTEDDVVEVARAFTGWTLYPQRASPEIEARIARARRFPRSGFVIEDAFIFRANAHDAGKKSILGTSYPAGRGIEDGLEVLDQLAAHPSTARHLASKLAVRFVSDEPPEELVERLAKRFETSRGDLREVLRALAYSPEFWSGEAHRAKIKSPFEVAVSALRILGAEIQDPRQTLEWIRRMGQPLYAYQAPTGYPDRADAWVNTGSLLHRMNFGLELATGRVAGLDFDLAALNGGREPESLDDALRTYVPLLLPERDPSETVRRLAPVIRDPELQRKIAEATPAQEASEESFFDDWDAGLFRRPGGARHRPPPPTTIDSSPLAHVAGVILGSPEFQRR